MDNFAGVQCELQFVAKEMKYHNSCRNKFHYEASRTTASLEKNKQSERTLKIEIREKAFTAAIQFVKDFIINQEEVHRTRNVSDRHGMLQTEYGLEPNDISTNRDYLFLAKLTEHFQGKIVIMKHETKGVDKIIFSSTFPPTKAFSTVFNVNNGIS